MKRSFEKYCKDYENIENYDKAKKDNFKGWHCHHRLETHNSDGERRLVDISQEELKALEMYYDRPANELIFLTSREHNAYRKGRHLSEEHKKKVSEALEGKPKSEEHKKKISEAQKGKKNHNSKKVRCIETGQIFDCISDANEYMGKSRKCMSICHCCKGRSKTAYGLHWEYID